MTDTLTELNEAVDLLSEVAEAIISSSEPLSHKRAHARKLYARAVELENIILRTKAQNPLWKRYRRLVRRYQKLLLDY